MRSHRARNWAATSSVNCCGLQSGLLGGALDLLAVLVGAGEEQGVDAEGALAACDDVGNHRGVGGSDVRARVDVIDRGGEVELIGHARLAPKC